MLNEVKLFILSSNPEVLAGVLDVIAVRPTIFSDNGD
jgi:hypothetical protein